MRTHSQIVKDHGASKLVRDLAAIGVDVAQSTPQRWAERNSIPGDYWKHLIRLEVATPDELIESAGVQPSDQGAAA